MLKTKNDIETVRIYLKERIIDYLKFEMGINTRNNFSCITQQHTDNHPSMSFDKKNLQVHCFQCGAKLDIFDIVGIHRNITGFKEQFEFLCNLYNVDITQIKINKNEESSTKINKQDIPKDFSELYKKWNQNIKNCDYLNKRGISTKVQKKYNIGYTTDFYGTFDKETKKNETWNAVIIPINKSAYVARNINPKDKNNRYKKVGKCCIFNLNKKLFENNEPIFITEGEIDALSFIEIGEKAIGLGSTANVKQFANKILKSEFLNNMSDKDKPAFIICLDNDKAGEDATKEIFMLFEGSNYTILNACNPKLKNYSPIYDIYHDANEILQNNRTLFISQTSIYKELVTTKRNEKVESYKKDTSAFGCLFNFWKGIKSGASTAFIPTGYLKLDEILGGGITEGLYIIGAISSLGKTTFTLQMADQIAKNGNDVLIFSLEMAKTELIAKSLSRITYMFGDINMAKTTRDITTSKKYEKYSKDELNTIENAVKEYSTYAEKIYIKEGIGDITVEAIRNAVREHIELTKVLPVVVIDYIQLIISNNEKLNDKQTIDRAVLGLKRLSRDYKIPVIAISSFNRQSYKEEVSMASFKESGALEYGSDVLIGLQLQGAGSKNFDEMQQKSISNDMQTPRRIELKILKNRNGRTGDTINYKFYSAFNFFEEDNNGYKVITINPEKVLKLAELEMFDDFL